MTWYLVKTKARQENIAGRSLQSLGVEIFSPQLKENRLIRKKMRVSIGPLFPGYFFANFDLGRQYRSVHYAHGVGGVVMFGASPATVDERTIHSIKSRFEDDYVVVDRPSLAPGQTVRIQGGAFEGLSAIFERELTAQQRVVLLLNTLSSQFRIDVDREYVALA